MVFQDYALFPHMSVFDNVAYGLKLAGLDRDQIRKRVDETLAFLGLGGLEARSPSRLSGGQQQRVALARALVVQPEVLLLDEPLSNLDAKLRVRIRDELSSIQRQLGLTTVYVTHDQDEALAMSDWIAVMEHGRIVQWGTPSEIYYQPRSAFVADFVGTVNLVPARIISADLERLTVELGGERLTLPRPSVAPTAGQVTLAIRPESLALAAGSDTATGPTLRGSIVRHSFLGHLTRYVVRVGDQEWLVDQHDPGPGPARGGEVLLRLDLARIHVLPGG
jgi:ABC-type Fe3+/spermidine/putrescine transport system ATPase subunit